MPAAYYAFFFFNDTATTEIYTLSLHDALPIFCRSARGARARRGAGRAGRGAELRVLPVARPTPGRRAHLHGVPGPPAALQQQRDRADLGLVELPPVRRAGDAADGRGPGRHGGEDVAAPQCATALEPVDGGL